jgi:hydrogenase nickel incorporation protein HypA/HybF
MHETFMAGQIVAELDRLAGQHRPCRLKRVVLKVGVLRQVVPELLRFALEAMTKDGPAGGADWDIQPVPATCRCKDCGHEFEVEEWNYFCPQCRSGQVAGLTGDELIIETVTLEQEEASSGECRVSSGPSPSP